MTREGGHMHVCVYMRCLCPEGLNLGASLYNPKEMRVNLLVFLY